MAPKKRPPTPLGEVIASQLKALRQQREMSQQQLADAMEVLGAPLDRSAIAKIESRTRGISAEEVVWLALALGCAPSALMVPYDSGSVVSAAPALDVESDRLHRWMRGLEPVGAPALPVKPRWYFDAVPDDVARAREIGAVRQVVSLVGMLETSAGRGHFDQARVVLDRLAAAVRAARDELETEEVLRGER